MIVEWHPVVHRAQVKNGTSNYQTLDQGRKPRSMRMISERDHGGGAMPRDLFPTEISMLDESIGRV